MLEIATADLLNSQGQAVEELVKQDSYSGGGALPTEYLPLDPTTWPFLDSAVLKFHRDRVKNNEIHEQCPAFHPQQGKKEEGNEDGRKVVVGIIDPSTPLK